MLSVKEGFKLRGSRNVLQEGWIMNKHFLSMIAWYTAVSVFAGSVLAFAGEAYPAGETASFSSLMEEPLILTSEPEARADEETYDTDFDGLSGNYLMAVNPEPWRTSAIDTENYDFKEKHIGFASDIKGTAVQSTPDERLISMGSENIHAPYIRCATLKMPEGFRGKAVPGISVQKEEKKEYKTGDVIARQVYIGYAGVPGKDYVTDNECFTSRVYQCLYTGELSTIWGSVSEDQLNDKEKKALKDLDKDMKGKIFGSKDNAPCDPKLQGIIGFSDNMYRTCVSEDSIDMIEELGNNFDEYIKKEREYTGDYLVADREYGDQDGKISFLMEPVIGEEERGAIAYLSEFDFNEKYSGNGVMDGLHIEQKILRLKDPGVLYWTFVHEVQHDILLGYAGLSEYGEFNCDAWINEWLAQTVSLQVNSFRNAYFEDCPQEVSEMSEESGILCYPYAYGNDQAADMLAANNNYAISPALGQYFIEHIDDKFVKAFTTSLNSSITSDSASEYLKEKTSHTLSWWLSAFSIALFSGVDGTDPVVEADSEYDAGASELIMRYREALGNAYAEWKDHPDNNGIIEDISALTENRVILGGGTVMAFRSDTDRTFNIKDIGKGVVWVLRDSKGRIVSVKGMEYLDGLKEPEKNKKQENPFRNPDGSWDYSDDQENKLSLAMRPSESLKIEGMDAELVMNLFAREAVFYNPDKKTLEASVLDPEKSVVSINGTHIPVKKVTVKNPKKAYISENSIFANTVSDNNRASYSAFKDNKIPGYYLVLDTKGLSGETKKAVKKANKQMKKNPFCMEILPIELTGTNFTVDKYNAKSEMVKKASVKTDENTPVKIRYNSGGKKDFTSEKKGELIIVTGTNNYNGQVSYDPASQVIKPV